MNCDYNPYALPTISFVGGETQEIAFNVYSYAKNRPYDLEYSESKFSIISFTGRTSAPLVRDMSYSGNKLTVKLAPEDTVNLSGKYIYQITIVDDSGDVEIPKQGILYITNNINKSFIAKENGATLF